MMAKLGDIATYINGYAFKPQDWSDEGIPIIRIQDLTGNSYQANRYNGEYASKYEVNDGDVLISWSASLGVYIWHGEKAVLNQHIFKVVFDKERISKDFFVHQVGLILENAASDAHGATMKHLTKPVFDALPFYLPPYEKQCEIAEVLDKVTSLISLRKQQLAKLDELVKARFVEMFGDLVVGDKIQTSKKKIGEIASVTKLAGFEFTKYIQYKEHGDIIMLRGLNCKQGKLILDDVKWIDRKTSDLLPRSKLYYGDILMTYAGTIGDVAMVDENDKYHLAPNVAKVSINNKKAYNPIFLMYLFLYSNDYIMRFASQVAQASINMEKIRNFEYYFPDVTFQNQFATFVERVDKQKQTVQQSLEKLELMKKALMQEYFG